jgi:hypothetical protein
MSANESAFKNNIKAWLQNEKQMKQCQAKMKKLKVAQKQLEPFLMDFMKTNSDENGTPLECSVENDQHVLRIKTEQRKAPVNKEQLVTKLTLFFGGDSVKAVEATEFVLKNRDMTARETLKKLKNRKRRRDESEDEDDSDEDEE